MSGHIARKGFLFQDLYLLLRVLNVAGDSLDAAWRAGSHDVLEALSHLPFQFGIEASASAVVSSSGSESLDWDVLVFGNSKLEFAEVKSGAVTKDDRIAFWKRLRRELVRDPRSSELLVPILVVDPSKMDTCDKWEGLAQLANTSPPSPSLYEPVGNVIGSQHLLDEALWFMCCPDTSLNRRDPPTDYTMAVQALSRFEFHRHESQKLELQVIRYLDVLFPDGSTDSHQMLLFGWLSKRATSSKETRRLFSIRELLQEVEVLRNSASLARGTLREWRILWNEVPSGVLARTNFRLGENGASISAAQVQPLALDVLNCDEYGSLVVLAPGGAGKSTFVAQAAEAARLSNDDVLHCGAGDVSLVELEELAKAVRFSAALIALCRPKNRLFLIVDGLDEAESELRERWAQLLVRMANLSNIRILVSMRDAVWRSDGKVRNDLESWKQVSLELWPEMLVRELLAKTPFRSTLPSAVVDLLRTPILLDLFWRAFVDTNVPDDSRASRLETRHGILAMFWSKRLLTSPRYSAFPDMHSRIAGVISRAALNVGSFFHAGLDHVAVETLLSEGVLVKEGQLRSRLRFRHPLLRDFALSQWCLDTIDSSELAGRWKSIGGGWQRHGALRAIVDALSDPTANSEYPELTLGIVLQAIVGSERALAHQVAQILGACVATPALDPAMWPVSVQSSLPPEFARDLLSFAKFEGNSSWATCLERWPEEATWVNKDFPSGVLEYVSFISKRSEAKPHNADLHEHARQAARKIRSLSEAPRFRDKFAEFQRWLKMQAMCCVIPILPDQASFVWVEREMPQSSWRTRAFLLEQLIHLASVDANRAAVIYRQAVGLENNNGRPVINAAVWVGNIEHQAIACSLAGDEGRRSLLKEYPVAFLPVAVDLAEALWELERAGQEHEEDHFNELMRQCYPSWSEGRHLQSERERHCRIGDLIDDLPERHYWRRFRFEGAYGRCVKALHDCVTYLVVKNRDMIEPSVNILRSSRMASVHTVVLDSLVDHWEDRKLLRILRECALDSRLYYVSGFTYWIGRALTVVWPTLCTEGRSGIFGILKDMFSFGTIERDAKYYLARLPAEDLPEELQKQRPSDDDASYQPGPRPSEARLGSSAWTSIDSDEPEAQIGEWPDDFDYASLRSLAQSVQFLLRLDISVEEIKEVVYTAVEKAKDLLPLFQKHLGLLEDANRFWVWQGLAAMLACFRRFRGNETQQPETEVVVGCAELALAMLKNVPAELPGNLPEEGVWMDEKTGWVEALLLADEALTWPPAADSRELQSRFIGVIVTAFAAEQPLMRLVCATKIRSWHWNHNLERRRMQDELIWTQEKDATVLTWSLSLLLSRSDVDRVKVLRQLLNRNDLASTSELAREIGNIIGCGSMLVFDCGSRSAASDIAREFLAFHTIFPFLQDESNCDKFLEGFIFEMKDQAKQVAVARPELATDYGDWALKAWRIRRLQFDTGSEGVVLLVMHWLAKDEWQTDRARLKPWWQQLRPLFEEVILAGERPDCFTLLFNFRSGTFNDLMTCEELFGLIEGFVARIRATAVDVDQTTPEAGHYHSWRDCAKYAAEAIDSLRTDGSLRTDIHYESAHKLLTALAEDPILCSQALEKLHHLQNS